MMKLGHIVRRHFMVFTETALHIIAGVPGEKP